MESSFTIEKQRLLSALTNIKRNNPDDSKIELRIQDQRIELEAYEHLIYLKASTKGTGEYMLNPGDFIVSVESYKEDVITVTFI